MHQAKNKILIIPLVDNGNLENVAQKKLLWELNKIKKFLKKKGKNFI